MQAKIGKGQAKPAYGHKYGVYKVNLISTVCSVSCLGQYTLKSLPGYTMHAW